MIYHFRLTKPFYNFICVFARFILISFHLPNGNPFYNTEYKKLDECKVCKNHFMFSQHCAQTNLQEVQMTSDLILMHIFSTHTEIKPHIKLMHCLITR